MSARNRPPERPLDRRGGPAERARPPEELLDDLRLRLSRLAGNHPSAPRAQRDQGRPGGDGRFSGDDEDSGGLADRRPGAGRHGSGHEGAGHQGSGRPGSGRPGSDRPEPGAGEPGGEAEDDPASQADSVPGGQDGEPAGPAARAAGRSAACTARLTSVPPGAARVTTVLATTQEAGQAASRGLAGPVTRSGRP